MAAVLINGLWGFVDVNMHVVIEPQFEEVHYFLNNRCAVRQDGYWGYIDTEGTLIVDTIYNSVGLFHDGLAPVKFREKWGYIDGSGDVVIPFQYVRVSHFYFEHAMVNVRETIDKTGIKITKYPQYDWNEINKMRAKLDGVLPADSRTVLYDPLKAHGAFERMRELQEMRELGLR